MIIYLSMFSSWLLGYYLISSNMNHLIRNSQRDKIKKKNKVLICGIFSLTIEGWGQWESRGKNMFKTILSEVTTQLYSGSLVVVDDVNFIVMVFIVFVAIGIATLGLHLGFTTKMRIWQVSACKMEPRSGIIS